MISTGELKKGVVIELEGDLWQILDYHHIKMGRGSAQVRIKFRNVKKGSTVEKSFQAGDRILVAGQSTGSQNGIYVVAAGACDDGHTALEIDAHAHSFGCC